MGMNPSVQLMGQCGTPSRPPTILFSPLFFSNFLQLICPEALLAATRVVREWDKWMLIDPLDGYDPMAMGSLLSAAGMLKSDGNVHFMQINDKTGGVYPLQ